MINSKTYLGLLPMLVVPLIGFSTDIYLPALPNMADELQVLRSDVQLTLSAFVIAMGLAQLVAGPISDAYGRKKLMVGALILQILMLSLIVESSNFIMILMARLFQGVGAAFLVVPTRAILNDCFSGSDLKKQFSYLTISFAVAPLVAPFLGGYCTALWGWRSAFYVVLIYAVIILFLVIFTYQDTLKQKRSFKLSYLYSNYRTILRSRDYVLITLVLSFIFAYTSICSVLAPFIFQVQLNLSPILYGYVALSIGVSWIVGNIANHLVFTINSHDKIKFSLRAQTILVCIFLTYALLGEYQIIIPLLLFILIILATAFIFPILIGWTLSIHPSLPASSNACLFALLWLAFGAFTLLATLIPVQTLLPLAVVFCLINLLSHLMYRSFACKTKLK